MLQQTTSRYRIVGNIGGTNVNTDDVTEYAAIENCWIMPFQQCTVKQSDESGVNDVVDTCSKSDRVSNRSMAVV